MVVFIVFLFFLIVFLMVVFFFLCILWNCIGYFDFCNLKLDGLSLEYFLYCGLENFLDVLICRFVSFCVIELLYMFELWLFFLECFFMWDLNFWSKSFCFCCWKFSFFVIFFLFSCWVILFNVIWLLVFFVNICCIKFFDIFCLFGLLFGWLFLFFLFFIWKFFLWYKV